MSAKQETASECVKLDSAFSNLVFSLPGIRATRISTAQLEDAFVDQAVIKGTEEYLNQSRSLRYGEILIVLYQVFKLAERGVEGAREALAKCLLAACINCDDILHLGLSPYNLKDKIHEMRIYHSSAQIVGFFPRDVFLHHSRERNFWYRCCKLMSTSALLDFLRQQSEYLDRFDETAYLDLTNLIKHFPRWGQPLPIVLLLHLAAGRVLLERKDSEGLAILRSFARKQSRAQCHFMSILLYAGDLSILPNVKTVFASTEVGSRCYKDLLVLPLGSLVDKESFDILVEGALRHDSPSSIQLEFRRFRSNCLLALSQRVDLRDRLDASQDLKNELEREVLVSTYLLRYYVRHRHNHSAFRKGEEENQSQDLQQSYDFLEMKLRCPREQDLMDLSIRELVSKALGRIDDNSSKCLCHPEKGDWGRFGDFRSAVSTYKAIISKHIDFGDSEVYEQDLAYYGWVELRQEIYSLMLPSPLLALDKFSTLLEILRERGQFKTPGAIEVLCHAADIELREWAITQSLLLYTIGNLTNDKWERPCSYVSFEMKVGLSDVEKKLLKILTKKCEESLNRTLFTASKEFLRSLFDAAEKRISAKPIDLGTAFVAYLDNGNINWISQIQDQEFRKEILIRILKFDSECSNLTQDFILQSEDGFLEDPEIWAVLTSKMKARFKFPEIPVLRSVVGQSRDRGFSTDCVPKREETLCQGLVSESNQTLHALNSKSDIYVRRRIASSPETRGHRFEDMSGAWSALKTDFDKLLFKRVHGRGSWESCAGFYHKQYYWGILTHGYAGFFRWYLKRSSFDHGSNKAVDAYEESIPPQSIRRITRELFKTTEPEQAKRYAQRLLKAQHPEVSRALLAGLAHPLPEIQDMFKRNLAVRRASFRCGASWQFFFFRHMSRFGVSEADRAMYRYLNIYSFESPWKDWDEKVRG